MKEKGKNICLKENESDLEIVFMILLLFFLFDIDIFRYRIRLFLLLIKIIGMFFVCRVLRSWIRSLDVFSKLVRFVME